MIWPLPECGRTFALPSILGRWLPRDRPARPGADLRIELEIELVEAARGATRSLEVGRQEPCAECGGSGWRKGTTPPRCNDCGGRGEVLGVRRFFPVAAPCPTCAGHGPPITDPCSHCRGPGHPRARKIPPPSAGLSWPAFYGRRGEPPGRRVARPGPRGEVAGPLLVGNMPSRLRLKSRGHLFKMALLPKSPTAYYFNST